MPDLWIYRSMALLAIAYGSAIIAQIARWVLPLLPIELTLTVIVIALSLGGYAFGLAIYQGRDRFVSYGSLIACTVGLTIGGIA